MKPTYFANPFLKRITNTADEAEIGYIKLPSIQNDKQAKLLAEILGYELILY